MRPGIAGLTMPGTVERGMRKFSLPLLGAGLPGFIRPFSAW